MTNTAKRMTNWAISSPENPFGYYEPKRHVHVFGDVGTRREITTSYVAEILRDDQRLFRTRSGSVYELVGPPREWWVGEAGASGVNDFAPFDVTKLGVVFLSEPTRGRIRRQGDDWLWFVSRGDDGLWRGKCMEDRPMFCRIAEMSNGFQTIEEARRDAVDAMERIYRESGGKRIVAAGGSVQWWANEPN